MINDDYDSLLKLLMTFFVIYTPKRYDQSLPGYHHISTGKGYIFFLILTLL